MTTPTNDVLDALNACAPGLAAEQVIQTEYSGTSSITTPAGGAASRALSTFNAIASFHGITPAALANLCRARPTYMGGISC